MYVHTYLRTYIRTYARTYIHTYLAERRINGGPPVTLVGRIRLNIVPHLCYKEEGQVRGDVEGSNITQ